MSQEHDAENQCVDAGSASVAQSANLGHVVADMELAVGEMTEITSHMARTMMDHAKATEDAHRYWNDYGHFFDRYVRGRRDICRLLQLELNILQFDEHVRRKQDEGTSAALEAVENLEAPAVTPAPSAGSATPAVPVAAPSTKLPSTKLKRVKRKK